MPTVSLILPYAIPEKRREKKFTPNMEFAAIVSLAEATRKKRTMIGVSSERVSFVSKLHYPFWAVPWENSCLILDGLQILTSIIPYKALPDIELFIRDIERGETVRELFRSALETHAQTFVDFAETEQFPVDAIITDKALLSSFSEYVEDALALKEDTTGNIVLTTPKLDEKAAVENAKKVLDLYQRIQSDIKSLEFAARVLNETTKFHQQMILREVELARETCKEEVAQVKPSVEKKVETLLKERDLKIGRMNRVAEAELNAKLREKARRERELEKLGMNWAEYKKRLDVRKRRHDQIGVARWEHSIRTCENKISEARMRLHDLSSHIERTRKESQEDVNKLKYAYQELIDVERKKIADIEFSFESVNEKKRRESEKLQFMTEHITRLINQRMEQKRLHLAEIKSLAIPWQLEQVTLLCVPFYLIGYKTKDKFHYGVHPPLKVMSSEGIVKKIEKAILSFRLTSRMKLLLQPRSNALNKMFSFVFEEKIKADNTLEKSLHELGVSHNLLANPNFRDALAEGLEELKSEGWINQEESVAVMKAYA